VHRWHRPSVSQVAERFGISDGTVYAWISTGKLAARRGSANRLYIPYGPDVEQRCRELVASSAHLPPETKIMAAGGAV
jgi:excisionase family DNA binding protein